MPTKTEADKACDEFMEALDLPENWHIHSSVDIGEHSSEKTQWMLVQFHHDFDEKTVEIWLVDNGVIRPFYDGRDWENGWGGHYDIDETGDIAEEMSV